MSARMVNTETNPNKITPRVKKPLQFIVPDIDEFDEKDGSSE